MHELAWMMGWLRHRMGAAVLIRVDGMMMVYMECDSDWMCIRMCMNWR